MTIMRPILLFALMSLASYSGLCQEYYPLAIGNRWDYQEVYADYFGPYSHTDSFSVVIIDTVKMSNGKTYFKFNRPDISWGEYVRVDSSGIYYWFESDSSRESLVYKLDANVGDFWDVYVPPTYSVRLEAIDTVILFGDTTRILWFGRDGLIPSQVTLSDKFGPVYFYSPGEPPGTSYTDTDILGCTINDTTYGVLVSVEREILARPTEFSLFQSYPNPSNARITIPFEIQSTSFVHLEIFNSLGQIVFSKSEHYSLGRHTIAWESGAHPSGVYYYRLSSNASSDTKRSMIVK